jgi:hypothetical protein
MVNKTAALMKKEDARRGSRHNEGRWVHETTAIRKLVDKTVAIVKEDSQRNSWLIERRWLTKELTK